METEGRRERERKRERDNRETGNDKILEEWRAVAKQVKYLKFSATRVCAIDSFRAEEEEKPKLFYLIRRQERPWPRRENGCTCPHTLSRSINQSVTPYDVSSFQKTRIEQRDCILGSTSTTILLPSPWATIVSTSSSSPPIQLPHFARINLASAPQPGFP